jgi:hypothetical protein
VKANKKPETNVLLANLINSKRLKELSLFMGNFKINVRLDVINAAIKTIFIAINNIGEWSLSAEMIDPKILSKPIAIIIPIAKPPSSNII